MTKVMLCDFFEKYDHQFRFGINRKFLLRVYKKMGFLKNTDEKEQFLTSSNYHKRVNY